MFARVALPVVDLRCGVRINDSRGLAGFLKLRAHATGVGRRKQRAVLAGWLGEVRFLAGSGEDMDATRYGVGTVTDLAKARGLGCTTAKVPAHALRSWWGRGGNDV